MQLPHSSPPPIIPPHQAKGIILTMSYAKFLVPVLRQPSLLKPVLSTEQLTSITMDPRYSTPLPRHATCCVFHPTDHSSHQTIAVAIRRWLSGLGVRLILVGVFFGILVGALVGVVEDRKRRKSCKLFGTDEEILWPHFGPIWYRARTIVSYKVLLKCLHHPSLSSILRIPYILLQLLFRCLTRLQPKTQGRSLVAQIVPCCRSSSRIPTCQPHACQSSSPFYLVQFLLHVRDPDSSLCHHR